MARALSSNSGGRLFAIVVVWTMIGYPIVAMLSFSLNFDSTILSIFCRAMVAIFSLVLISRYFRRNSSPFKFLVIIFWFFYFCRLAFELHVENEVLSRDNLYYWSWSLGVTFIPAVACLVAYRPEFLPPVGRSLTLLAVFGCAGLIYFGSGQAVARDGSLVQLNRWNLEALNPISMGHFGASTLLLGFSYLFGLYGGRRRKRERNIRTLIMSWAAVALGATLLVLANSRGPILAAFIALAFLSLSKVYRGGIIAVAFLIIISSFYVFFSDADWLYGRSGILSRFLAISEGRDLAAQLRMAAYTGAIEQFLSSPIIGDGIEERTTGYYPHNVVVEAFMATGILGGVPFLGILFAGAYSSWKQLKAGTTDVWLPLLTLQFMIGAQFSGALYTTAALWLSIMLSVAHWKNEKLEQLPKSHDLRVGNQSTPRFRQLRAS